MTTVYWGGTRGSSSVPKCPIFVQVAPVAIVIVSPTPFCPHIASFPLSGKPFFNAIALRSLLPHGTLYPPTWYTMHEALFYISPLKKSFF